MSNEKRTENHSFLFSVADISLSPSRLLFLIDLILSVCLDLILCKANKAHSETNLENHVSKK